MTSEIGLFALKCHAVELGSALSVGDSHIKRLLQQLSQQLKMKLVDGVDVAEDGFHRAF